MTLSQWSKARVHKDNEANLQTYQVGAHFEALSESVLMAPSDSRYTEVGFNLFSVEVCHWSLQYVLYKYLVCQHQNFHYN